MCNLMRGCCGLPFWVRICIWLYLFYSWYCIFTGYFLGLTALFPVWALPPLLLVWNGIWLLAVTSLLSAAFTLPPPVPKAYRLPEGLKANDFAGLAAFAHSHPQLNFQFVKNNYIVHPRACESCGILKPMRTHHCRRCGQCFPRMDHHCPVIGGCVHAHNHKFFMLFLFWANNLCVMASALMSPSIIRVLHQLAHTQRRHMFPSVPLVMSMGGLTNALACGLALLCFQVHLWLMLMRNRTTLEWHSTDDFGLGSRCANVKSIFGPKWQLWLLPVPSTPDTGYDYVVGAEDSEDSSDTEGQSTEERVETTKT